MFAVGEAAVAVYVVGDLPKKFAGVKIGPTLFLRDAADERAVARICDTHPFQVVLAAELDSKMPRPPGEPDGRGGD